MKLRAAAFALTFAMFATAAFAQTNSFLLITNNGTPHTIGKASYTIDKAKDGFKVKARFEYRTGPADGAMIAADPNMPNVNLANTTDFQFSSEYKVDGNGNYLSGYTQNSATQTMTSLSPSKSRDALNVGQMQGGTSLGSRSVPVPKPDFLVAPDYDPSAVQVLLMGVLAHPHSDHQYLLAAPVANAGKGGAGGATNLLYIAVGDATDASGTLDGKAVALKHYPLVWNQSKGDMYADANGTLMQINVGPLNASYVRVKFKLDAGQ